MTSTPAEAQDDGAFAFAFVKYARKHRYRVRNLHDGGPVPPARYMKPKGQTAAARTGFVGKEDRCDAIVGCNGYIGDEGEPGRLGIYLQYRSARGVKRVHSRIQALGGTVKQVGDAEVASSVPTEKIEEALRLIRVSKVPLRNPGGHPKSLLATGYRTHTGSRIA
ncbi:MAG: hypothetical protein JSU86_18020 [Phycisphaerales bacterium]|nr:MAG: hypothetical protein JSU86_18020 [Phycisphaerales bacterium]